MIADGNKFVLTANPVITITSGQISYKQVEQALLKTEKELKQKPYQHQIPANISP